MRSWWPAWFRRFLFWVGDRFVIDRKIGRPINAFREEHGLQPVRRVWNRWLNSPQRAIGLFPEWFGAAPDWPAQFRQTGFVRYDQGEAAEVPPVVRDFLAAGEPPVVFSFGSAMRVGRPYFEAAVEACRRGGFRGLLLAKGGNQIPGDLPAGVVHADYAPFSRVFPRARAVVHHGGIGTSAQGLAAGVPQLVMPMAFDQVDNAHRLARLGVARVVPPSKFTGAAVADALRDLLSDPRVPAACQECAAKMATDPLPKTCQLIEELQGKDRPSR
jgi:UDP:flavonoid glycosyltransferase YjiC (YdhE family)